MPPIIRFAIVLAIAWLAGREDAGVGVATAVFGLTVTYVWGWPGIPSAAAMALTALYVPGVVVFVIGLYLLFRLLWSDRRAGRAPWLSTGGGWATGTHVESEWTTRVDGSGSG